MRFNYRHTHVSRGDGSPAMAISADPFVLINEDGHAWLADPKDWEVIRPPGPDTVDTGADDRIPIL